MLSNGIFSLYALSLCYGRSRPDGRLHLVPPHLKTRSNNFTDGGGKHFSRKHHHEVGDQKQ
jgi:hypothetical protein